MLLRRYRNFIIFTYVLAIASIPDITVPSTSPVISVTLTVRSLQYPKLELAYAPLTHVASATFEPFDRR